MSKHFDSKPFRDALGAFTTGVTIVTTHDADGNDIGLTANSFNSVSLDPPMVLWSLAKSSLSLAAFKESRYFAVHILSADQEAQSNLFATRGADKFSGLELERGQGNVPLLSGCSARFECEKAFEYEGGDHEIFVGQVVAFEDYKKPPLVFQAGKYAVAVEKPREAAAEPEPIRPNGSFGKDSLLFTLSVAHHQLRQKLRPILGAMDLTNEDYAVLMTLLVRDQRSEEELSALLAYMGQDSPASLFQGLCERDMIETSDNGMYSLTTGGRTRAIEVIAATKAIEEDAEEGLDYGEKELLGQYLRKVIRQTDTGQHRLWGS